ncbi:tripartite tricarboxylate transporter substrate-binding protein [Ramlibacter tataouinensis]|uniref:Candidate extracytoplasmic binding receptor n=1 Tax=Ramlibacter tataouinensis (strain ATCC BAA-407 / DSM 14655 / LMG 21543 / TTB310) TaxID=365046 RepID=F5Y696_RAMTT|nr:tripartite tricarboxylate transporter substrate-binding protein [Ramlibacter tataouinensis]AEG92782.1 Candidate extracytoplasmic binding receptor [Ramlibacter tataouinensis TTB310]
MTNPFAPLALAVRALATAALGLAPLAAASQDFPSRPITMVMPYAPGGPGDTITRVFAAAMQNTLGQQILVDNTAGASGTIGSAKVARAKPDGYTLLMIHVSHATNLAMFKDLPYHPVRDFEPVGSATSGPMVIVARNGFPPKDLAEFVTHVKANPAKVNLAHAGVGSASHLCGLMMMSVLGVQLNEIPYKGTGPALTDLMGGQVDLLCDQTSGTVPPVKAGRIKAYAAAGKARLPSLPEVPAIAEAGIQGFDINISFGLYAPKGTPQPVLGQLTAALQKAVTDPEVRSKLEGMGIAAVGAGQATPAALRAHLAHEIETLGGLLAKAGVKAN